MNEIAGSRCARCGHLSCPPVAYCPKGCGATMEETRLRGSGHVYSSSLIHVPHPEFGTPYQVGYVDLEEGPRLFGHLGSDDLVELGTAVTVDLKITDDPEHGRQIRVTFTPARADEEVAR